MLVKEIDSKTWNELNSESPNGTIFSDTKWLDLIGTPYKLLGVFKGNELVGGAVDTQRDVKLTQYHGITLLAPQYEYAVSKELSGLNLKLLNHYTITDMRPFLWEGYRPFLRYTYLVHECHPDKDTRYEITKAIRNGFTVSEGTILDFWDIYKETFERKNLDLPVDKQWFVDFAVLFRPRIYLADNLAGVVMMSDEKRDYYIFGASREEALNTGASSLSLSTAIQRETDLVGCNNEKVGMFKRGFGGELKVILGVECIEQQ
jgi:hypothetical protein